MPSRQILYRFIDLENKFSTSAEPCHGVVGISRTAQRLDPIGVVLLVLDHSTDVIQLKGALVQQSECVGWNRTVSNKTHC